MKLEIFEAEDFMIGTSEPTTPFMMKQMANKKLSEWIEKNSVKVATILMRLPEKANNAFGVEDYKWHEHHSKQS